MSVLELFKFQPKLLPAELLALFLGLVITRIHFEFANNEPFTQKFVVGSQETDWGSDLAGSGTKRSLSVWGPLSDVVGHKTRHLRMGLPE